jgi:hypothetical protein
MNSVAKAYRWVTELSRLDSRPAGNRLRVVSRNDGPKYDGEKYSGGGAFTWAFALVVAAASVSVVVASVWACRFVWCLRRGCLTALTGRQR